MRHLLAIALLFSVLGLSAQSTLLGRYVMAGSFSSVTAVDATTHTATIQFQSDQTGNGYLANQVAIGYRVLTSTKRMYRISSISSTTFSSATVTLVELPGTTEGPNGVAAVYEYNNGTTELIPLLPSNSTGISAAMASIIHTHNVEVMATLGSGSGTVVTAGDITGDGSAGSPVTYTRPVPTWAELSGKPAGFADGVDNVNPFQTVSAITGGFTLSDGGGTINFPAQNFYIRNTGLHTGGLETAVWVSGPASITRSGTASAGFTLDVAGTSGTVETMRVKVTGTSADANASGELVLRITRPSGNEEHMYAYQLYDLTNNQKVDEHLTGNVGKIVSDASYITFTLPNIAGNYPNGFLLILH